MFVMFHQFQTLQHFCVAISNLSAKTPLTEEGGQGEKSAR